MKELIYENNNSLSSELCNKLIDFFENEEIKKYNGLIGLQDINNTELNKSIKNTIDLSLFEFLKLKDKMFNNDIIKILIDEIENSIEKYNELLKQHNINFLDFCKNKIFIDGLSVNKYKKGEGKITYHNDFYIDFKNKKYRIINFLWYLNNVEEGGETEFFGCYKIKPEKGKLILFPSDWYFPHSGKIPVSNDKYVLTGWIYTNIKM